MKDDQEYCPQCPNHCHKSELKCGRGRAYFSDNKENSHLNPHEYSGIFGLLKQCVHLLHHNHEINNEKLCENLSQEEQKNLENLLNKILLNIK